MGLLDPRGTGSREGSVPKYEIEFVEVDGPITDPVTKFGGQPVWVGTPAWPLSRRSGVRMTFICQVEVFPELFGGKPGRMAYLFMTGDEGGILACTWEPDLGENAVLVQPDGAAAGVETVAEPEGPTVSGLDGYGLREYSVVLHPGEDPGFVGEERLGDWDEEEAGAHVVALEGNKIGGTPGFIQGEQFPDGGPWRQLLQLDSAAVPFRVNFGDAGVGHVFLSEDGRRARFLWQCY